MNNETDLIGGVYAYVVTTPEPTLTITGHTGVITGIRFRWTGLSCSYCRKAVTLWADGGTIEAGIRLGEPRRHSATAAHWFTEYHAPNAPVIPAGCPHPGCRRPPARTSATGTQVPAGWLDGRWRLTTGTFTLDDASCLPAQPNAYRLLDDIWLHIRADHADLAAAADRHRDDQQRRRENRPRRS